jgi:hypothetical protein
MHGDSKMNRHSFSPAHAFVGVHHCLYCGAPFGHPLHQVSNSGALLDSRKKPYEAPTITTTQRPPSFGDFAVEYARACAAMAAALYRAQRSAGPTAARIWWLD